MQTVAADYVDQKWFRFTSLNESDAVRAAEKMHKEQPFLMVYLLAVGQDPDADPEELSPPDAEGTGGGLLELGAAVWHIMSSAKPKLRTVDPDKIEATEAKNLAFLEKLDAGPDMQFEDKVRAMMAGYNQMPLLSAVLEALMQGYEDEPELAPEDLGMHFLYLKTVIDCLDQ